MPVPDFRPWCFKAGSDVKNTVNTVSIIFDTFLITVLKYTYNKKWTDVTTTLR